MIYLSKKIEQTRSCDTLKEFYENHKILKSLKSLRDLCTFQVSVGRRRITLLLFFYFFFFNIRETNAVTIRCDG